MKIEPGSRNFEGTEIKSRCLGGKARGREEPEKPHPRKGEGGGTGETGTGRGWTAKR